MGASVPKGHTWICPVLSFPLTSSIFSFAFSAFPVCLSICPPVDSGGRQLTGPYSTQPSHLLHSSGLVPTQGQPGFCGPPHPPPLSGVRPTISSLPLDSSHFLPGGSLSLFFLGSQHLASFLSSMNICSPPSHLWSPAVPGKYSGRDATLPLFTSYSRGVPKQWQQELGGRAFQGGYWCEETGVPVSQLTKAGLEIPSPLSSSTSKRTLCEGRCWLKHLATLRGKLLEATD